MSGISMMQETKVVEREMQILQLLPQVPPAVCGVGDYAWNLARCLRSNHGIYSSFLAAGTQRNHPQKESEFPLYLLPVLKKQALANFIASNCDRFSSVILHVSTYGFQKRGVPFWLASGWQAISRVKTRPKLVTMYHELSASGPVTSSAFWLRPLQEWILRRIALNSDALRTNREGYANWLRKIPGIDPGKIISMPVYSNFGEPDELPHWLDRDQAMVMFGWGIFNGESLSSTIARAVAHCKRLGLSRLHILGGGELPNLATQGIELCRHGFMPAAEISKLLLSCRIGYSAYNPEYFGKSTLMAAFAAHGLGVICQGMRPCLSDGLHDGVHLLNESTLERAADISCFSWEAFGRALRGWYQQHSLAQNAASYADQLRSLHVVQEEVGSKF